MSLEKNYKSGFVSISGLPNSGKSTLLNSILNEHISAVSPKPQTTRYHLKGIKTTEKYQIIFVDTPGFIKPKSAIEKVMRTETTKAIREDADVILLLVQPDISEMESKMDFFSSIFNLNKKTIIAINKIDIYKKEEINEAEKFFKTKIECPIIKISAFKKINLCLLENEILNFLPYSPPYYYDDILSDRWERYFVSEAIREEIFLKYRDEIPYQTAVDIESFKEDRDPIYILANIYLSKKSHKLIIIGRRGEAIRKLRVDSQKKIENFLNKRVKLELFVKVRENWMDDINFINLLNKDYK